MTAHTIRELKILLTAIIFWLLGSFLLTSCYLISPNSFTDFSIKSSISYGNFSCLFFIVCIQLYLHNKKYSLLTTSTVVIITLTISSLLIINHIKLEIINCKSFLVLFFYFLFLQFEMIIARYHVSKLNDLDDSIEILIIPVDSSQYDCSEDIDENSDDRKSNNHDESK